MPTNVDMRSVRAKLTHWREEAFVFFRKHRSAVLMATVFFVFFAAIPSLALAQGFRSGQGVIGTIVGGVQETVQSFTSSANNELMGFIGDLMQSVFRMLSQIVLFLVDIFLNFARYNGFSDAAPVVQGWSIVRDVVNMFFIVILLVSAFATIIGYDSNFRYDRVLPKLLLMAILINFSRTLVQLLVDFSQVVMLTFVNAFKDAGAGNLVNALGMTRVIQSSSGATPSLPNFTAILSTYGLNIALLVIMIMVLTAMIAFVIVRVIGLWLLLIFSPIALFATALPDRLKKGISSFTNDYWSQLSNYLVGGPVFAFFLYLTLATVQRTTNQQQGLANGLGLFTTNNTSDVGTFMTQSGQSSEVATFVVAVAMLLMGLKAGTSIASQVGGFNLVNTFLRSLPKRAVGAGLAAGALGLRGGAWVGRETGRGVARIARPAVGAAAAAALAVPGLRTAFRAPLAKAAAEKGLRERAEAAKMLEPTKGMRENPTLLARYRESLSKTGAGGIARQKIDEMLGKTESGKTLLEEAKKRETGSMKERIRGGVAAGFAGIAGKANEMRKDASKFIGDAVGIGKYRAAAKDRSAAKSASAKEYLEKIGNIKTAAMSDEDRDNALFKAKGVMEDKNEAADQKYKDRKNEIRAETVVMGGRLKDAAMSKVKAPIEAMKRITESRQNRKNALAEIGMREKTDLDEVRTKFVPQKSHISDQRNAGEIDQATYGRLNDELEKQINQALNDVKARYDNERENTDQTYLAQAGGAPASMKARDASRINLGRAEAAGAMANARVENEVQIQANIQLGTEDVFKRKSDLATQRAAFHVAGDTEQVSRIDATYLEYPHLSSSEKEFKMNMGSILLDKELQKKLSDEALNDGEVQSFLASKALVEHPTTKHLVVDSDAKKDLMKQLSKNVAPVVEAYLKKFEKP